MNKKALLVTIVLGLIGLLLPIVSTFSFLVSSLGGGSNLLASIAFYAEFIVLILLLAITVYYFRKKDKAVWVAGLVFLLIGILLFLVDLQFFLATIQAKSALTYGIDDNILNSVGYH